MLRRRILSLLLSTLLFCALWGCTKSPVRYEATFFDVFDTITVVRGYAAREADFSEVADKAHALLSEYHQLFDIYHDSSLGTNLKTVNDHAGGAPVSVDARILDLLRFGQEVCTVTGGKVDITYGAVLALWHDARESALDDPESAALPEAAALQEAARHTGFSLLELDAQNGTVRLTDPLARLDVGAIAKGFAAQRVAEILPDGYLLSLGGNVITVGGRPDGTPFVVGIQDPNDPSALLHTLYAENLSVVTSGDYQRSFALNGVRYHHIIDPATRFPADRWRAVTVLCADSADADALSTALFLLTYEDGCALLARYDAEAIWIAPDGTEYLTDGFAAKLRD